VSAAPRYALVAVLGLSLGAGAALLGGAGSTSSPVRPAGEPPDGSAESSIDSPEPPEPEPIPSLERWLATVELPAAVPADGTIEGRVIDDRSTPVEGARLRVESLLDPERSAPADSVLGRLIALRTRSRSTVETRTDAEGRFACTAIPSEGEVRVTWVDGPPDRGTGAAQTRIATNGAHVEIAAPRLGDSPFSFESVRRSVHVRVGAARADRVALAAVRGTTPPASGGSPEEDPWDLAWREQRPEIRLHGSPSCTVRAFAHGALASEPVVLGESDSVAELELLPCTSLHVRWLVAGGLRPRLVALDGETELPVVQRGENLECIGLSPGDYELLAGSEETVIERWPVRVEPGFNRITIEREFDERVADFSVDIVDPQGRPVRGVSDIGLHLDRSTPNASNGSISSSAWRVHSDGRRDWYSLGDFVRGEIQATPDAPVTLVATDPIGREGSIQVPARLVCGHHTIRMPLRPQRVEIEIDGYVGSEYEGRIHLQVVDPEQRDHPLSMFGVFGDCTIPDLHGRWVVEDLGLETVEIIASVRAEPGQSAIEYYRSTFDTQGPDGRVLIPLPRFVSFSVRLPEILGGRKVLLDQRGAGTIRQLDAPVTNDPIVTFEGVPPGEYEVRCSGHRRTIEVAGGERIDFELQHFVALRVEQVRVEGLDLRRADVVTSIDGVPVDTQFPHEFVQERTEADTDGVLILAVERDGVGLEVPVPTEHFRTRPRIWFGGIAAEE